MKGKPRNHILLANSHCWSADKSGQYVPCTALVDSAFQSLLITERCVQRLRLSRIQTHASIQGIRNVNTAILQSVWKHLRSRHTDWHNTLHCAILSHITCTTLSTKLDTSSWKIPKDIKLADEQFDRPGSIYRFIGPDLFYKMLQSGTRTRPGGYPILQETVLGWTLWSDSNYFHTKWPTAHIPATRREQSEAEHKPLLGSGTRGATDHDIRATTLWTTFHHTHTTQQQDGRFVVRLPTKMNPKQLESSRLCRAKITCNWKQTGTRSRTQGSVPQLRGKIWRSRSHGTSEFTRREKHMSFSTTSSSLQGHKFHNKKRVVFDGEAKTSNGLSLNDTLQIGPTLQQDLYSIVLRFGTHQVCFTANKAKVYFQIVVHPQDRDLQRILWRYSSEEIIQEYRLNTVTYGTSSAPFLATYCLKKLADDNKGQYPRAAQVLSNDFYVNDLLSGTSTIEDSVMVQQEISSLLQTAEFTLSKWAWNHTTFLDTIPRELQETQQTLSLDNEDGVTTLGLLWNARSDQLQV